MKKYKFFQRAFFCLLLSISFKISAQYITYPINGTVIQQSLSASGNTKVYFTFAEDNAYNKTLFYRIKKADQTIVINKKVLNNPTFTNGGGLKGFYAEEFLDKGWYIVEYYHEWNRLIGGACTRLIESKEFGVGDVYFVAGQSNASGYTDNSTDNVNAVSSNNSNNQEDNVMVRAFQIGSDQGSSNQISKGFPMGNLGFENLKKELKPIYPNGVSSWCWAPLGNEFANKNDYKTPTMFFNVAFPNSSLVYDWIGLPNKFDKNSSTTLIGKFYQTLGFYGNIFGAKAVLWHQGERDSQIITGVEDGFLPVSSVVNNYQNHLTELIDNSRSITGLSDLSWFVSKVSYTSREKENPSIYAIAKTPTCIAPETDTGYKGKLFSSTLHGYQQKSGDSKVFLGVNTDFLDGDNLDGNFESSFDNTTTECVRSSRQRIHFTGNYLGNLGHAWYNAITANYNSAVGKPSSKLLKLNTVTKSSNNFTFTVETPPTTAVNYYWCKNDAGINNATATSGGSTSPAITLNVGDRIMCYAKDNTGKFYASQPFIRDECKNCRNGSSLFTTSPTSLNFISGGETKSIIFNGSFIDWDVQNIPSWITSITWNDASQQLLLTTSNNTGGQQSGYIEFVEVGTTTVIATIPITQAASSGGGNTCTETNLSSFTPINPEYDANGNGIWSGWGSKHDNKSVENNTMTIGGQQYTVGIGTHAGSTLVYNLGGQYNTFSFRVGRDDEADNCDCGGQTVQFEVFVDNVSKFISPPMGTANNAYPDPTQNLPPQSINVAGASTLTLKVYDGGDNYWGDHADWVNTYLQTCANSCTTQAPTPQNVGSSNPNITAGQSSTLQATCSVGIPTWSNGTNVVSPSVTTTYYVNCINGACPISATVQTTVTVTGGGSCAAVTDGLVMGTWYISNLSFPLVARKINDYNAFYLTQRINNSPETFAIRASQMLQRPDVVLNNGSYSALVGCFNHQYSGYGGLATPNLVNPISLNTGSYYLGYGGDGTPIYTQSAPPPPNTCNGCTGYLDGAWCPYGGGWAKSGSNGAVNIDVYIDGQLVQANMAPNYDRPDVGGYYGFIYSYPVQFMNGQNHQLVYKFAGTNTSLVNAPQYFNCTGNNMRIGQTETSANAQVPDEMQIFMVFPNPTNEKLTAKFGLAENSNVTFEIVDLQGRNLETYNYKGEAGLHTFIIDVSKLNEGSYILRGMLGNKLEIRKFVVER